MSERRGLGAAVAGAVRQSGAIGALGIVVALFGLLTSRQDYLLEGATAMTFAIAATGLGLALGLSGEYLLGQIAVFAIGAYTTADLTANRHWSFWPACVLGVVAASLAGLVISVVGLRISRFYFALVGFFLVYLIPDLTQVADSQTGGGAGLAVPDLPSFFGHELRNRGMFFLALVALLLSLVLVQNVRLSPLGIQMRWMRVAPLSLATFGVRVWRVRLATYVLSSALAGLGGAIYSHLSGYLLPDDFDLNTTVLLFAAVVVGGATSLLGPTVGIVLLYVVPRLVINVSGYSDIIYGAVVLISVVVFRDGVDRFVREGAAKAWWWIVHRVRRVPLRRAASTVDERQSGVSATASAVVPNVDELADLLMGLRDDSVTRRGSLVIRGARKAFGGVVALVMDPDDVVAIEPGRVHVLLGPNGSGKTTLLNALCGVFELDSGSVSVGGDVVNGVSATRLARLGVSRSFQSPQFPVEMSPVELLSGSLVTMRRLSYLHWMSSDLAATRARRDATDFAARIAAMAGLETAMNRPCSGLTSGQRRILDVLLALVTRSSIVLLDEPAAGLSNLERRQLGDLIRALAARGMGLLAIEHDLDFALRIADEVTVLANGRRLAHGRPDEVRADPLVRTALVGGAGV
ncbi:MAG TPA: ATP-binding cassette domain-containing protein [Mycobacteriales bacterium]|nr:ATP-binding cassette domain-containing protein [Mycobacteriales bacterium]